MSHLLQYLAGWRADERYWLAATNQEISSVQTKITTLTNERNELVDAIAELTPEHPLFAELDPIFAEQLAGFDFMIAWDQEDLAGLQSSAASIQNQIDYITSLINQLTP